MLSTLPELVVISPPLVQLALWGFRSSFTSPSNEVHPYEKAQLRLTYLNPHKDTPSCS